MLALDESEKILALDSGSQLEPRKSKAIMILPLNLIFINYPAFRVFCNLRTKNCLQQKRMSWIAGHSRGFSLPLLMH